MSWMSTAIGNEILHENNCQILANINEGGYIKTCTFAVCLTNHFHCSFLYSNWIFFSWQKSACRIVTVVTWTSILSPIYLFIAEHISITVGLTKTRGQPCTCYLSSWLGSRDVVSRPWSWSRGTSRT